MSATSCLHGRRHIILRYASEATIEGTRDPARIRLASFRRDARALLDGKPREDAACTNDMSQKLTVPRLWMYLVLGIGIGSNAATAHFYLRWLA